MSTEVTTFSLRVLLVALITCLNFVLSEQKPLQNDYLEVEPQIMKRFNFNFLRTWQPLARAEPLSNANVIQRLYDDPSNIQVEEPPRKVRVGRKDRIRQRLLCISAFQHTKKCEDI